jgi:hypothetical protein
MRSALSRLVLAALVLPALVAGPARATGSPIAPTPGPPTLEPVVLDGAAAAVRWRNVDPRVVRVVVRRADGVAAPVSPAGGAAVFDGAPLAPGVLQVVADAVTVGDTYTYAFWSFDAAGDASTEASHSIRATGVPLLVAPAVASDAGTVTTVGLRWGNPANPAGNPYTVKYQTRDPATGALSPWVIWLLDTSATHAFFGAGASPLRPVAGATYRFEVLSQDPYGNDTRHALATLVEPFDVPAAKGFTTLPSARRWGGTVAVSGKAGAKVTWHVVGSQVTVIADRCPGCGRALLRVDGKVRAVIDTHAAALSVRKQVGSVGHLALGPHTVSVEVVGTTGHPAVHLDGLAVLD